MHLQTFNVAFTDPCDSATCFPNSQCFVQEGSPFCQCLPGFTLSSTRRSCVDVDECSAAGACGKNAICQNSVGSFTCKCPAGAEGDPYDTIKGCIIGQRTIPCTNEANCSGGGQTCLGGRCVCRRGFITDENNLGQCVDLNECLTGSVCGPNAVCKNLPGSYDCECPQGFSGNPFVGCQICVGEACGCSPPSQFIDGRCQLAGCSSQTDCAAPAQCVRISGGVSYCACPPGYEVNPTSGKCEDVNECRTSFPRACANGAICENNPGSYTCYCLEGSEGDAYSGACVPVRASCANNAQCRTNERCVAGSCVCSPPFYIDNLDGNRCKSPCDRFNCGLNSECTPTNPPQCLCKKGFSGNPLTGCEDLDECLSKPCGTGANCINTPGGYQCQCPRGSKGDPYITGCVGLRTEECSADADCPGQLACITKQCSNPCSSIPCGANANCVPENHAAWCRCKSGYTEDAAGRCVSACQGIVCGLNAQCIVSSEGPSCVCLEGMFGNPYPGGRCTAVACSQSSPCRQPGHICQEGKCVESCGIRSCGLNSFCDPVKKICVCAEGFVGDPNLVCMPPTTPPVCTPDCGANSHCEYGLPHQCACNAGFQGNPYTGCLPLVETDTRSCATIKCGANAICSLATGLPVCVCQKGFEGLAYDSCRDVNECINDVCGDNAICINTAGSYDCRCKYGFVGNPFEACTVPGEQREDLCKDKKCGPNAICNVGQCLCAHGFKGDDPYDLVEGCSAVAGCNTNTDCGYNEICSTVPGGTVKFCVDPCAAAACGPNSFCVTDNHHMNCICNEGFTGNANDLTTGCIPETRCKTSADCKTEGTVCQININGRRACVDPCQIMSCPDTEYCKLSRRGRPICECREGLARNKLTGQCESYNWCQSDEECLLTEACKEQVIDKKTCTDVCASVSCPIGAECFAKDHKGHCRCSEGFTGRPSERSGCVPVAQDECSSDAQCGESDVCESHQGRKVCTPACGKLACGPGAVCVARNHIGKCICPTGGLFKGDPYRTGCEEVKCLENDDCPIDDYCDRLSYTCMNACKPDLCGENALCIPENHAHSCQCPPGFVPSPTPQVKCVRNDQGQKCPQGQCQTFCLNNQQCLAGQTCQRGLCVNGCASDTDCIKEGLICLSGRCRDPCSVSCGPNSLCEQAPGSGGDICRCPPGFAGVPTAQQGCVRIPETCSKSCPKQERCYKGYCMPECQSQAECARGEHCQKGICLKICHSDKNCLQGEICVDRFCDPGCRTNTDCREGETCNGGLCGCAAGFAKTPRGCVDIDECQDDPDACPSPTKCINTPGSHTCQCPANTVPDPATGRCRPRDGCARDNDCAADLACLADPVTGERRCSDPCDVSFCTPKAKCSVVGHKPFCSCPSGHRGDPTDPAIGCYKVECEKDDDCPAERACDGQTLRCVGKFVVPDTLK